MSLPVVISTPTLTGQVGALLTYLDRVLCLGQAKRDSGGFTDHSAEARTEGGTAFTILASTTDAFYVGYDAPFTGLRVGLATAGANVTLVVEYWTGSAWSAVTGLVDGTTQLSQSGQITWTLPTTWAKNAVDGATYYHIRLRSSSAPTTAPTADFLVVNWTIVDDAAGTNAKVYGSIGEDSMSSIWLWVDDNGTAYTNAANAAARLYETWDAGTHTGTGPTPTVAQASAGVGIRKSSTADSTARTVYAGVDRDRVWLFVLTGDTTGQAISFHAGKFASYVTGDAFGQIILGWTSNGVSTYPAAQNCSSTWTFGALHGQYLMRAYTGSGGALQSMGLIPGAHSTQTLYPPYPNADGSLLTVPRVIVETGNHVRGELARFRHLLAPSGAALANGDVFTRPDGTRWWVVRTFDGSGSNTKTPWVAMQAEKDG